MKTKTGVLRAAIACVVGLMSVQAQADIIKNTVRVGAFEVGTTVTVPLTQSGEQIVAFSGSGKFTIWYTAECAAAGGYVDVEILVDGIPVAPTGANTNDSFCDFNTRGAMHTVTGRTNSLAANTHFVQIRARTDGVAFLSDSSLLIGK
jgi:hypothetical protein